jgi:arsenite methyltransferase
MRNRDHPPIWARGAELRIERGHVKRLPFGDGEFDAVISTNTIYFWPELEPAFAELRRVLRPSGRLVVGFSGAEKMRDFSQITRHGFQLHDDAAVVAAAVTAGFPRPEIIALHGDLTEGDFLLSAARDI